MTDEKKPNHNKRIYPDLSLRANGKEGVEVNAELSGLFQRFMGKLKEDPSFGVGSHPTLDTRLPMLNGGLKPGEISAFLVSTPGPFKSDIFGHMYRQKLAKSWELKDFIDKGVGTATEMMLAQAELEALEKVLAKFTFPPIPQEDIGLIVSLPMDHGKTMGMRAFRGNDGALDINSFNLINCPEEEFIAFHRRNQNKPSLVAAVLMASLRNCVSDTVDLVVEKTTAQLAKENKYIPFQHPKKRPLKLNPLIQGLIKRAEE